MENETKRVSLSTSQVLELAGIIDTERQRVRELIKENPNSQDNPEREGYIARLDALTKALVVSVG